MNLLQTKYKQHLIQIQMNMNSKSKDHSRVERFSCSDDFILLINKTFLWIVASVPLGVEYVSVLSII